MSQPCPVCTNAVLHRETLPQGLSALRCESCRGLWISSASFWRWHDRPHAPDPTPMTEYEPLGEDSLAAKLCPECRRFLTRYKVGHGLDYHLDHCATCGGTWMDAGEWDGLCERGLEREFNRVFTTAWQHQLRDEASAQRFESLIQNRLGSDDYRRTREVIDWIDRHEQRDTILGYLMESLDHKIDR